MPSYSNVQPSLVVTESIVLEGIFPSRDSGGVGDPLITLGYGMMFACNFAPRGFATSSGQLMSISQNTALFSILGTTYGGNGQTTFQLPDLRSSLTAGQGSGPGLSGRLLGDFYGSNETEILDSNLPTQMGGSHQPLDNTQETLTARYVINTDGVFPSGSLYENTLGVVHRFYGNFDPAGTMECDGRLLNIADYEALFAVLGTTYGGDGVTTFALPDLRGRTIIGTGQGPGLSEYELGQVVGTEANTLLLGNMGAALGGSGLPFNNIQPALAMNMMIVTQGLFPSRNQEPLDDKSLLQNDLHIGAADMDKGRFHMPGDGREHTPDGDGEPYLSQILYFAGTNPVFNNAVQANGQVLPIAQNTALFSLLGTQFGGNGQTNFALPDFRGRSAMGSGDYSVGTQLGTETAYTGIDDLPARSEVGGEGSDGMTGGSQDDQFFGNGGNDYLAGNGGNDALLGNDGADTLLGGDGDDRLRGGAGIDDVQGGLGNDIYLGVTADDVLVEGVDAGIDTIETREATFTLPDNFENLVLLPEAVTGIGNTLDNSLTGTDRANILDGLDGNDTLDGRGGVDQLVGGAGNDVLDGGTGDDSLDGGADNDTLIGGDGRDTLLGGDGDDMLNGGADRDVMTGGIGADSFVFTDGDFQAVGFNSADSIADFSGAEGDTIDLTGIDADLVTAGDQSFTFIGGASFTGAAGELRYDYREGFTLIKGDTDGDAVPDFVIRLDGTHVLSASNFNLGGASAAEALAGKPLASAGMFAASIAVAGVEPHPEHFGESWMVGMSDTGLRLHGLQDLAANDYVA